MAKSNGDPAFAFADIAGLTDVGVQMILRNVDTKDLAIALKGAKKQIRDRIFSNVSRRVGTMLREEMVYTRVDKVEVEKRQSLIAETLGRLVGEEKIDVPSASPRSSRRPKPLPKRYLAMKRSAKRLANRPLFQLSYEELDELFVGLATVARREGILELEGMMQGSSDPFFTAGIRLAVDGTEPELIYSVLSTWMTSLLHEQGVKYRKVLEGIVSAQSGDNPRIVEHKLSVIY